MNLRKVLAMGGAFFLGNALSKAVTFVAYPAYTYFLRPEALGLYDLSVAYGTILGSFLFMDAWVGVMKKLLTEAPDGHPDLVRAGLSIVLSAVLILFVITLVLSVVIAFDEIWWLFACIALGGVRDLWAFVARGLGHTKAFALSGLVSAVVGAAVSLSLLAFWSSSIVALYCGVAAGCLAQTVFLNRACRISQMLPRSRFRMPILRALLVFSWPLAINSVSYWVFSGIGRVGVSVELSLAQNGVFAVASKFGAVLGLLAGVITLVWQQMAFARGAEDRVFFERGMTLAVVAYTAAACALAPLGMLAYMLLVEGAYQQGARVVPGFMVAAAIGGYSNFVGNIFYAIDKTRVIFYSTLVVLVVVVASSFPLIRWLGIDGANIALVLGYVCGLVVRYKILFSSAEVRHPWRWEGFAVVACVISWASAASGQIALALSCTLVSILVAGFGIRRLFRAGSES